MEKSGEHAIPVQAVTPAQADQLAPPSTEKYILPLGTVAASLVKSGVEAIPPQFLLPAPAMAVHVTPLSLDLYTLPPDIVAAIFLKSGEAAIPCQLPETGADMVAVLDG
jgi:hypothetical protein